jgi:hypothetical protein
MDWKGRTAMRSGRPEWRGDRRFMADHGLMQSAYSTLASAPSVVDSTRPN